MVEGFRWSDEPGELPDVTLSGDEFVHLLAKGASICREAELRGMVR